MPTVQLADIVDVEVHQDLPAEISPEKTHFAESGIIVNNENMNGLANREGDTVQMPFWVDLGNEEANISNDDPTDFGKPQKVNQKKQTARKAMLNKGYSEADLASELVMGDKPMRHIKNRFGAYWNREIQARLMGSVTGVALSDMAQDETEMTVDVSAAVKGDISEANLFGKDAFIDAAFTLGDSMDSVGGLAMHTMVYKQAVKNNDIEFIEDSKGMLSIPTYMGKRVLYSDNMPVMRDEEAGIKYLSVLFGQGAFAYGNGTPTVPVEISRSAAGGGGGGIETFWERKTWLVHPFGYAFDDSDIVGASPTIAELKDPAAWTLVVDRKNVPLAVLITNAAEKKNPSPPPVE